MLYFFFYKIYIYMLYVNNIVVRLYVGEIYN